LNKTISQNKTELSSDTLHPNEKMGQWCDKHLIYFKP